MKAVGYQVPSPISDDHALVDIDLPRPVATGRDILVKVKAVSVNPVDTKIRASSTPPAGEYKVLGWDASGIVEEVGPDVSLFKKGDAVWYAGSIARPGSNSEFHLVDERIAGIKPTSISFAEAAALPLTTITAWETLFDRLQVNKPVPSGGKSILIIGGAGGVGSIAVQLAKVLTNLTVLATASRPETKKWVQDLGAHHVIDHTQPIAKQVSKLGIGAPSFVFSTTNSDTHFDQIVELIAPQGRFALIDDPEQIDVRKFKRKAVSTHWELMFTRSLFGTDDMIEQHHLLNKVAELVDTGSIKTTVSEHFGTINAANLKRAHAFVESGKAKGKVVLEGF
ncbi:MAG: zinc-binding alcohol dehydrogenase family protein [Rhizobiaceae bacterium]